MLLRNNLFPLFSLFFYLAVFYVLAIPLSRADTKEEILAKYETAVQQAEDLHIYEDDTLQVIPKIRLAGNALLNDDAERASAVLNEALSDLKLLQSRKPSSLKASFRLEFLEIYADVLQKYALLVLLALAFVRWPYYRKMLKGDSLNPYGKILIALLAGLFSIFLSFFDFSRYGESAWTFFDIQVVTLVIGGLLGGVRAGVFAGALAGLFRWLLKPGFISYLLIVVGAGLLAGIFSKRIKNFRQSAKPAFVCGSVIGVFHGIVIYIPAFGLIPWYYLLMSIGFVGLLEGVGVYIFFAVIAGVMREENRKEVEQELLKTRLLFLQAQMSPHFIFNTLNTISAICGRERALQAQGLILKLAAFLRRAIRRADEMVTLREEIEYIDTYLEIESTRFQDRLKVDKHIEISESSWNATIPMLILQPLVENAVKHGIAKKESGGTLDLKLTETGGVLKFEISDNGPGIRPDLITGIFEKEAAVSNGSGIGVRNIQKRLLHLYGPQFGLQYESHPGKGTRVSVRIPLKR